MPLDSHSYATFDDMMILLLCLSVLLMMDANFGSLASWSMDGFLALSLFDMRMILHTSCFDLLIYYYNLFVSLML